jgi:macrodomain Ter protein organizer (MatP/YcbG family)
VAEQNLEYRIWQHAAKWHWQVIELMDDIRQFIASGVADSARAARIAALKQCLQYLDRHPET